MTKARPGRTASTYGDDLTPAELRILQMISIGKTTNEIAGAFGNSPETIRNHVKHIFEKLETRTRAEAVAIGFRKGILK